jgi:nucleotide-binding universal stress UspA family protein
MPQSAHSTIVVGIDGTEDGLRAVDYAATEALTTGCPLLLMHVIALSAGATMGVSNSHDILGAAGERVVESARARAALAGVPKSEITVRVVSGPVTSTLISASKQADLMVLGRRGLSGLDRVFAGSTSTSVGARAGCPVVVVPRAWSPQSPYGRVVVGVDGSARSLPALAMAVAEASSRSAELVVVHAWEAPAPYYVESSEIQDLVDSRRREAELAVSELLAGWSERHPDIRIRRVFETRHPVEALVGHSAEGDLLVIGTRGGGGIPGLALGSVARAVVAGSCSPVLLVRRGPRTLPGIRRHRRQRRHAPMDAVAPTF